MTNTNPETHYVLTIDLTRVDRHTGNHGPGRVPTDPKRQVTKVAHVALSSRDLEALVGAATDTLAIQTRLAAVGGVIQDPDNITDKVFR